MKVLIVGRGGREHALAWKLRQSLHVTDLYIAPGNAGTAELGKNIPARTSAEICDWLSSQPVDLVVIGPDDYLAEGLADRVSEMGMLVFGPTRAAAEIEWSKSYAKRLMQEEGIPTASYETFTDSQSALSYLRSCTLPAVIKADGLAAGKGVVIAETREEAENAVRSMLDEGAFGNSGTRIIVEEYLQGFEISVHAFCDGESAALFPVAKDHKRALDGDRGPNTGGMGTIAPVPSIKPQILDDLRDKIVLPTLAALKKRGRPFRGVLFPGVMLTARGPMVIEFNARFGDPETQSYMRLLESDLLEILLACISGTLNKTPIRWRNGFACCVVAASKGYPGKYETGIEINTKPLPKDVIIFHAGTALKSGKLVTSGGRVFGITATGDSLQSALSEAYDAMSSIEFEGMQYRRDIGASSGM